MMTRSPVVAQRSRGASDLIAQGIEGVRAHHAGDGAVVDEGELLAASALDVEIEGIEARVEPASRKPPVVRWARVVEDLVPSPVPVDVLRRGRPESLRVAHGALVGLLVDARHLPSSRSWRARYRMWALSRRLTQMRPAMANRIPAMLASWATRNGPSQ